MFLAYFICYLGVVYIIGTFIHRAGGYGMTNVKNEKLQEKISNLGFWMSPLIVPLMLLYIITNVLNLLSNTLIGFPAFLIKAIYSKEFKKENERISAEKQFKNMGVKTIKISNEEDLANFIAQMQEAAESFDSEAKSTKDKEDKVH